MWLTFINYCEGQSLVRVQYRPYCHTRTYKLLRGTGEKVISAVRDELGLDETHLRTTRNILAR